MMQKDALERTVAAPSGRSASTAPVKPARLPASIGEAVGYDEFWPFFLGVHTHPGPRSLHALATVLGMSCAVLVFPATLNPAWLLIGLGVAYPIAWFSHFVYERRRPAAFTNPFWELLCDVELLVLMAAGRFDRELERARLDPGAPVGRGRRLARKLGQAAMFAYLTGFLALELLDLTRFSAPF